MRALILVFLLPVVGSAQISAIAPGSRIRSVIPAVIPELLQATFVSATADSVWLRDARGRTKGGLFVAPRLALTHSQIASLDVMLGRNRGRGAAVGLASGLVGGVLLFGMASASSDEYAQLGALFGTAILVPVATLIGAAVGAEEWRQVVPLPSQR